MIKLILFALTALKLKSSSTIENRALMLKRMVLNDLLAISFRILFGIILVATVIISISHLEKVSTAFFEQFQHGIFIEVFAFAGIAIGGCLGLYWLFRKSTSAPPEPQPSTQEGDLQGLLIQFAEGFIRGMDQQPAKPAAQAKE